MSISGKARRNENLPGEIRRINADISSLFGFRRTGATPTSTQYPQFGGASPNVANSQSYLKTAGDTMIGPFALNPASINSTFPASVGHITVATTSKSYVSNAIVNFAPSSNNLSFIDGDVFDGQILYIHVITGNTLTVKTDGNIIPVGNVAAKVLGPAVVGFIFDSSIGPNGNSGGWIMISDNGGNWALRDLSNLTTPTAVNQDIHMGNHIIDQVNSLRFNSTGSPLEFDTSGDGKTINLLLNGFDSVDVTNAGAPNNAILLINGAGTSTSIHPELKITNVSASPANTNTIGGVWFDGANASLVNKSWAKITVKTDTITAGAEAGSIRFSIIVGGLLIEQMYLDQSALNMNIGINMLSSSSITANTIAINDGFNITVGTVTGSKIGASAGQKLGFWGITPVIRQTVTGSRGGNAALQSLLSALNTAGIITDSSTV